MIRQASIGDLLVLGNINSECFSGNGDILPAMDWIETRVNEPIFRIWIAEMCGIRAGYIIWEIKGGLRRQEPVVELEQFAVDKRYRNRGIGHALIERTLEPVGKWVRETNNRAGETATIIVWTGVENPVNHLYHKFFSHLCGIRHQYPNKLPENMHRGTIQLPPKAA